MKIRLLVVAVLLFSLNTRADEGELHFGAETSAVWAWVPRPVGFQGNQASGFMQQAGVGLSYGLTDSWHLGIKPSVTWNYSNFVLDDFTINNLTGELHFDLMQFSLPLTSSFRLNTGTDWSAMLELSGGYSLEYRADRYLSKDGFLLIGPDDLSGSWNHGFNVGAALFLEHRFSDWLIVQAGPSFSAVHTTDWGFFPGFTIRAFGSVGIGTGLGARAK